MNRYLNYTLHLLRCVVSSQKPESIPDDIDIDELFQFCHKQQVEVMVYYALKSLGMTEEELGYFSKSYMLNLARTINQEAAFERICVVFESENIDFLPLKGIVFKNLFPSPDMRQAVDIDIYIGKDNASKVCELMLEEGYETDMALFEVDNDDAYIMKPYVRIEMHRNLCSPGYKWSKECNNILTKIIKVQNKNHQFEMTKEDFYLYMIMHIAKHMHLAGCGIKDILDIWIYWHKYEEFLDKQYINTILKRCKLLKFNSLIQELSLYWFSGINNNNPIIGELEEHIIEGGWVGGGKDRMAKYFARNYGAVDSKIFRTIKYVCTCVFLPYDRMCRQYPTLGKYKFLLPYFWIKRICHAFLHKRNEIKHIFNKINTIDEKIDSAEKLLDFDDKIGL